MRDIDPIHWPQHISSQSWNALPQSSLEHTENLEQLRLIEAGIGIDTFQQLELVRSIAASINATSPLAVTG